MAKMMRINQKTSDNLDELTKISGMSKQVALEKAVEALLREQFLKKTNEEFAYIKAHPELRKVEIEERNEWEITLQDGLENE